MNLHTELRLKTLDMHDKVKSYIDYDGARRTYVEDGFDDLRREVNMLEELVTLKSLVPEHWQLDMQFGMCPCPGVAPEVNWEE